MFTTLRRRVALKIQAHTSKVKVINWGQRSYWGHLSLYCDPTLVFVFFCFFYPLLLWVFLVCFACYALLHIRGHSHSPPLICHYMSYLISTFTETTPGHMAPTRECTHFDQSCHKSMWASDYIIFRHVRLAETFSLDSMWVGDTEKHLTKIS